MATDIGRVLNFVQGANIRFSGTICMGSDCNIYGNSCIVLGMNCKVYGADCIVSDKSSTIYDKSSKYVWEYPSSITCKEDDARKKILTKIMQEVNTDSGTAICEDGDDLYECVICLDRKKNILFLPCRHVTSCTQCVRNEVTARFTKMMIENCTDDFKCGVCNMPVKKVYRMYS